MGRLLTGAVITALFAAACGGGGGDLPTFTATESTSTVANSDGDTDAGGSTSTTTSTTTVTTPVDPTLYHERGDYAVGVVTLDLGDRLAEVYYPAAPSDEAATEVFDSLTVFPANLQALIPPELSGLVDTMAVRGATIATDGPPTGFPIVVYSHGFGGYRQVATAFTTHLASWGHVVVAVDHLERGIAAQANNTLGEGAENQDELDMFAGIEAVLNDDTLSPIADASRIVLTGHSAGGWAAAGAASDARVDGFVSIAGGAPATVVQKPALIVIAESDSVVSSGSSYDLFDQLTDAALINIADAGHNSFTDSCRRIRDLGGLGDLEELIGAEQVSRGENGCTADMIQPEASLAVLAHYTVAFIDGLFGGSESLTDVTASIVVVDADPDEVGVVRPRLTDFRVVGDPTRP